MPIKRPRLCQSAVLGIVNIFEPSRGDVLTFPEDGFSAFEVMVNGEKRNLVQYAIEKRLDTKLPLVANYHGVMINASFQEVDAVKGEVRFYAPFSRA